MKENIPLIRPVHFSHKEFNEIVRRSAELIKGGYFIGVSLIQAEHQLPQTSIIIHFLHSSRDHLDWLITHLSSEYFMAPRNTYYLFKPEYAKKQYFEEDYRTAVFFEATGRQISMNEAINTLEKVIVCNNEQDLVIPLKQTTNLAEIVYNMQKADRAGPRPWVDPVIIIKTKCSQETLENFFDACFVSITRMNEEFYLVLNDARRICALTRYLNTLCKTTRIGSLTRSNIVFTPSQINKEFAEYLTRVCNPLRILE